jgi:hypothetical protein
VLFLGRKFLFIFGNSVKKWWLWPMCHEQYHRLSLFRYQLYFSGKIVVCYPPRRGTFAPFALYRTRSLLQASVLQESIYGSSKLKQNVFFRCWYVQKNSIEISVPIPDVGYEARWSVVSLLYEVYRDDKVWPKIQDTAPYISSYFKFVFCNTLPKMG